MRSSCRGTAGQGRFQSWRSAASSVRAAWKSTDSTYRAENSRIPLQGCAQPSNRTLDAAKRSQVVVTTHSPDVLDYGSLPDGAIRVVAKTARGTAIAPVANSSREAIRQRLYSPGELLRSDELNPDLSAAEALSQAEDLFGEPVHAFGEDG